jgi:predicted dehydrogenase
MRMTDRTLRAAVIGLGAMGANRARLRIGGVELAAVADVDPARVASATHGRAARPRRLSPSL